MAAGVSGLALEGLWVSVGALAERRNCGVRAG